MRAGLLLGLKVPKPKIDTLEPVLISATIVPSAAEIAASACFFSSPVSSATESTNSVRFTAASWRVGEVPTMKELWSPQVKHFP